MAGWLVNDRLTAIPGTRTLWHHLLDGIAGLEDRTLGSYSALAETVDYDAARLHPDYVIRNAAYFRRLEVACPVISFVQDILAGEYRRMLIDACGASRLTVFNSNCTRNSYPELQDLPYMVIPVGTDTSVFHPSEPWPGIAEGSVLWVGSTHPIKGFELARRLSSESPRPWVFVLKEDGADLPLVFRNVPQEQLARIASACAVAVCTSGEETQHLAGIEAGMCGTPIVTTPVGTYWGRPAGPWGQVTRGYWHDEIEAAATLDRAETARYWIAEGMALNECIRSWNEAVNIVAGEHAR